MTHPQSPNFGFANRMYHQLSENWQFYGMTTGAAAVAGGLLRLAGQAPLAGMSLAAATAFTGGSMVYNAYLKDSSQATILGSAAVGAAGFGAMALMAGGGMPLTAAAAALGFGGTAIAANVKQLLDLKHQPDLAHQLGLTEKYGAARLPHKVKANEAPIFDTQGAKTSRDIQSSDGVSDAPVRLNAGWRDLTDEPGFTPQPDVKYLWVIRDDGHLITGVEDPKNMPSAFPDELRVTLGNEAIQGLGHPTLAVVVGPDQTRPGAGRIGGELERRNGNWVINDHSGRYGSGRGDTRHLLVNAAELFREHGIPVRHIQSKKGTNDEVVDVGNVAPSTVESAMTGISTGISVVARKIADMLEAGTPPNLNSNGPAIAQPALPNIPQAPRVAGPS